MVEIHPQAVAFVRDFISSGRPVAAICHAPWTLVEADVVRGRRLTSWPSLQTDIRNAGGEWVDEPLVTDGNLTTSRKPDDLPKFCGAVVEQLETRLADAGLSGEVVHFVGAAGAADSILDHAGRVDAELVVIGQRRRSPVGKLVLGSTSQRVLLEADCPVVAVKAPR